MAHARITGIDTSEAVGAPGVLGVFTAADLDLGPFPLDMPLLPAELPRSALAAETVRYVGEPIVAVVAETRAAGRRRRRARHRRLRPAARVVTLDEGARRRRAAVPRRGHQRLRPAARPTPSTFSECEVVVTAADR